MTTETATAPVAMTEIEVVYMGGVTLSNNKRGIRIAPLSVLAKDPSYHGNSVFDNNPAFRVVGGVYKIEAKTDGATITNYRPKTAQFVRQAEEIPADIRAAWEIATVAADQFNRAKTREKTAENDTAMQRALDVLKFAYRQCPRAYRTAFQVWLVQELEK